MEDIGKSFYIRKYQNIEKHVIYWKKKKEKRKLKLILYREKKPRKHYKCKMKKIQLGIMKNYYTGSK